MSLFLLAGSQWFLKQRDRSRSLLQKPFLRRPKVSHRKTIFARQFAAKPQQDSLPAVVWCFAAFKFIHMWDLQENFSRVHRDSLGCKPSWFHLFMGQIHSRISEIGAPNGINMAPNFLGYMYKNSAFFWCRETMLCQENYSLHGAQI